MDSHWRHLFDQIEQFNPDVPDGGLAKDDHLDTLAMSGSLLKGRALRSERREQEEKTPEEALLDGEITDAQGLLWASKTELTIELVEALLDKENNDEPKRKSRI